ncbi:MAG: permease prefix domain 1-containing protein [Kibdelosporangium sp.]
MAGASVIDDYVADLDGRLRGDRRAKTDLLTEARDSLEDAAECYRDAGFSDGDAQRKAVREFGSPHVIARGYQGELAAEYGARTLRSILFTLPLANIMWELTRMLWIGPWENFPGAAPPDWYYPFAELNDTMTWAVAVAAALGLLVGRLMSRRTGDSVLVARCAAGVSFAAVGLAITATSALMVATAAFDAKRLYVSVPCLLASVLSILVMARLTMMARRTALFSSQ